MKTIKIMLRLLSLVAIIILAGCAEKILQLEDPNSPTDETFFRTEAELEIAVAGVYGPLYATGNVPLPVWMDHLSDIGYARTPLSHWELQELGTGLIVPTTTGVDALWSNLYVGIQRANNLLEKMVRAQPVTDPDRYNEIRGEALFLRAYYYHFLVELYGDIPHRLTVDTSLDDLVLPRESKAKIVSGLLADLEEASQLLPDAWGNSERGRPSANAANALRARIALFNSEFNIAEQASLAVITNGTHSLDPDFESMLTDAASLSLSDEIIMDLSYLFGTRTHQLNVLQGIIISGAYTDIIPTQQLVDTYETVNGLPIDEDPAYDPANPYANRDPRLKATLAVPQEPWLDLIFETHSDSAQTTRVSTGERVNNPSQTLENPTVTRTGYVWKKFVEQQKMIDNEQTAESEFPMPLLRYAEVLLTYAEAKIENGTIDQTTLDAINDVRSRAYGTVRTDVGNYPAITSLDAGELRKVIKRERAAELANEGLRLIDLKRWGIVEKMMTQQVMGSPANGWSEIGGNLGFVPSIDDDGFIDYTGAPMQPWSGTGNLEYRIVHERNSDPNKYLFWPIPQREIDAGGGVVTQNPGY